MAPYVSPVELPIAAFHVAALGFLLEGVALVVECLAPAHAQLKLDVAVP